MGAGKAVDADGSQPGYITQQNDGVQAYTQALMALRRGTSSGDMAGPKEWIKFTRPVVLLRIALYGHPNSGALWEQQTASQCCWSDLSYQTRKGGLLFSSTQS